MSTSSINVTSSSCKRKLSAMTGETKPIGLGLAGLDFNFGNNVEVTVESPRVFKKTKAPAAPMTFLEIMQIGMSLAASPKTEYAATPRSPQTPLNDWNGQPLNFSPIERFEPAELELFLSTTIQPSPIVKKPAVRPVSPPRYRIEDDSQWVKAESYLIKGPFKWSPTSPTPSNGGSEATPKWSPTSPTPSEPTPKWSPTSPTPSNGGSEATPKWSPTSPTPTEPESPPRSPLWRSDVIWLTEEQCSFKWSPDSPAPSEATPKWSPTSPTLSNQGY